MKTFWVCVFVGVVVFPCFAAETLTSTCSFGREGKLWDRELNGRRDNLSLSWTHTLAGLGSGTQVTEATLTFTGIGINNVTGGLDRDRSYEQTDVVTVTFMGQTLGQLTGNTTTFQISPTLITEAMNADAEIAFQNDVRTGKRSRMRDIDWRDLIRLTNVTLNVVTQSSPGVQDVPTTPPVGVPAPGALVLAGIGTLLVGMLRRRGTIE